MSEHKDLIVVKPKSQLPMVVEENGIYAYLDQIKNFPVLSEDVEKKLISDFQTKGDLLAAQKLITSQLRLAAKIALTYRRYGLPMSDVISEANLGLMQAVKKFDMDKKVRLATYAIWWIKAAVNDYILRSWSLVKIGTVAAQKKLFYNLSRIKARVGLYENKELEPKVVKAIAHELMVDEKDVTEMNRRIGGDSSASSELLTQGPFVMNTRNHTLEKNGTRIRLTQVEYAILKLFMQNPGRALSREDILSAVWGRDYEGELKIVDVNIRRLRMKVEDEPSHPTHIMTVWGYGYRWEE